jgi:hypothetical protein
MITVFPYFLKDLEQSKIIYLYVHVDLEDKEEPTTQLLRCYT